MPTILSAFYLPMPSFSPQPGDRRPAIDRPQRLNMLDRCWWGGHSWDYRMSTQRVIIKFRQCLRCGEVEIQVG
jgi:hypothetical protein